MVTVIAAHCPQNHPCPMVRRCPNGALEQQGYRAPQVRQDLCLDCGDCTVFCPAFQRQE